MSLLAPGELLADFGRQAVMVGGLDQEHPSMAVAAFGDGPLASLVPVEFSLVTSPRNAINWRGWAEKRGRISQLADKDTGSNEGHAAQALQGFDDRPHAPFANNGFQMGLQLGHAMYASVNGLEGFFQDEVLSGMTHHQFHAGSAGGPGSNCSCPSSDSRCARGRP